MRTALTAYLLVAATALAVMVADGRSSAILAAADPGDGTAISVSSGEHTVTKIVYTVDPHDSAVVSQVDLHLAGAVVALSDAKVRLTTSGGWYGCSIGPVNDNGTAENLTDDHTPLTCTTTGSKTSRSAPKAVTVMVSHSAA
ncbi:MAG: hypothetical protein M3N57_10545 [Actinomycetota bacterium]|nr:hypothetical protein [Actinomycetota bacterium]